MAVFARPSFVRLGLTPDSPDLNSVLAGDIALEDPIAQIPVGEFGVRIGFGLVFHLEVAVFLNRKLGQFGWRCCPAIALYFPALGFVATAGRTVASLILILHPPVPGVALGGWVPVPGGTSGVRQLVLGRLESVLHPSGCGSLCWWEQASWDKFNTGR